MAFSQIHGNIIEKNILSTINAKISRNPTAIFDGILKNEQISVKTENNKSGLYLGDIKRIYNYDNYLKQGLKITLILWKYKQVENYKIMTDIYEININMKVYKFLWGEKKTYEKSLEKYIQNIKNIPKNINKKKLENIKKEMKMIQQHLQKKIKEGNGNITINPKIDSKTQRRVQCSINKKTFEKLIKIPNVLLSLKKKPVLRGKIITNKLLSKKRRRNV